MKATTEVKKRDSRDILSRDHPELILGLVGPIGVDMDTVQSSLSDALKAVGYSAEVIHITKLLDKVEISDENTSNIDKQKDHYKYLIKKASLLETTVALVSLLG